MGKMRQHFGCILVDIYVDPAVLSLTRDPKLSFLGKMRNFLRFLVDFLLALVIFFKWDSLHARLNSHYEA